jgi:hypothetical protein
MGFVRCQLSVVSEEKAISSQPSAFSEKEAIS